MDFAWLKGSVRNGLRCIIFIDLNQQSKKPLSSFKQAEPRLECYQRIHSLVVPYLVVYCKAEEKQTLCDLWGDSLEKGFISSTNRESHVYLSWRLLCIMESVYLRMENGECILESVCWRVYSEECRLEKYLLDNYNGGSILEKVEWRMYNVECMRRNV